MQLTHADHQEEPLLDKNYAPQLPKQLKQIKTWYFLTLSHLCHIDLLK
jgi:hypothetical protein